MASENPTKRNYEPRELRLLNEWIDRFHSDKHVLTRVRLGAIRPELNLEGLTSSDLMMLGLHRRWADALIIEQHSKTVVEAKIVAQPVAVAQLELYAALINDTPELAEYRKLQTKLLLLCAVEDPVLTKIARDKGIEVSVYTPSWLNEYFSLLRARERRPPRS